MTLATALKTGDLTQLPSRRDEDWRWTDLRGLIRALPPASPVVDGDVAAGPFDGLATGEILFVNGRQRHAAQSGAGDVVALRFVSASDGTAHAAAYAVVVEP
ncbi:MAG: Fe-S cluster assembly protein SufD, partial [Gemmatimonadaceae bacterium]|nr:Fe-S cluster assembly protein SufD [Caulobacter sp.]